MSEPTIALSFSWESQPTWEGFEPDPVLRCAAEGCPWSIPIESDDWSDRSSSAWFRAEQHMSQTGHAVHLFPDRDEIEPWET